MTRTLLIFAALAGCGDDGVAVDPNEPVEPDNATDVQIHEVVECSDDWLKPPHPLEMTNGCEAPCYRPGKPVGGRTCTITRRGDTCESEYFEWGGRRGICAVDIVGGQVQTIEFVECSQ